jgi:hypothetical protein
VIQLFIKNLTKVGCNTCALFNTRTALKMGKKGGYRWMN